MKVLVTGGGGFLGGAIIDLLLARGIEVRSLSRGRYPALEARGVECIQADLSDPEAVTAAALGWDVSMFFTFYGLELLKKDLRKLKVSPLGNPAMPMKIPAKA